MNRRERIVLLSRQRGALAVTTPLLIVLLIILTVLLLDGARLYATKRTMQAQANAAAIAAAGFTQSCGSIDGQFPRDIEEIAVEAARDLGYDCADCMQVQYGFFDYGSGVAEFRDVSNFLESDAVKVIYVKPEIPISIILPDFFSSISMEVSAAAKREVVATFYSDTSTASLNTAQSDLLGLIFGSVLGTNLSLQTVNFESLRDTLIDVESLVADLAGGSAVEDILATDVTARMVLQALREVSGATGAAGSSLDQLIAAAGVNTNINLGEIIDVAGVGSVPAGARIPLLSVINATVYNIAKSLPSQIVIDVPQGLIGGLTGLSGTSLQISIDEAPRVVIAPARQDTFGNWLGSAVSTDVQITASLQLDLDVGLVRAQGNIPLTISTGMARTDLTKASCAVGLENEVIFSADVYNSLLGLQLNGSLNVTALFGVVPIARLVLSANSLEGQAQMTPVDFEPFSLDVRNPVRAETGDPEVALSNAVADLLNSLRIEPTLLGILPLGTTLNGIVNLLRPLLNALLSDVLIAVIAPLLDALGVSVGSTNVVIADAIQPAPHLLEGAGDVRIE